MASFEWDRTDWTEQETTTLTRKARVAGYADAVFSAEVNGALDEIRCEVTTGDDPATFKANVEAAALPFLSVDVFDTPIAGDGVATGSVVVTDSRGAAANGKTVKLLIPDGNEVVDKSEAVLAGVGQATFTFGPSPTTNWTTAPNPRCFRFCYENAEAELVEFCVRYTG